MSDCDKNRGHLKKAAGALGKRTWLPRALRNLLCNQETIDRSLLKSVSNLSEAHEALSKQVFELNRSFEKQRSMDALVEENRQLKIELASLQSTNRLCSEENEVLKNELSCLKAWGEPCYEHDFMRLYHKNMAWMRDDAFVRAYQRGMDSGHKIGRSKGSKDDIHIEWRVHTAIWAAKHALKIPGDFVECGVNTGILSLAICDYLDFHTHHAKKFFLFDTYAGIPETQMSPSEREARISENKLYYEDCYERAKLNFADFPNVELVRGLVPGTLPSAGMSKVAYLHLDMNIAYPELAAVEYFWDRLSPGAVVLLDDYGWEHYSGQQRAMDAFAEGHGVSIATLPTGQGLLIKP